MTDKTAAELRAAFAAGIGGGHPSPWREAFRAIPREAFVPVFHRQDRAGQWAPVTASDPGYLEAVYSDTALMTQLDANGIPTSSSSEPGLMLDMLDALDAHPGETVFELGTGTGYNAALLCHRLGADHVTSVDVDPELVALATRRLGDLGLTPVVTAGDGALGYSARAPYSRIIATAALRCIPPALMEQAAPGAVIVAPIGYGVIRAVVTEAGHAKGRFLSRPALFMPRRSDGRGPDFDILRDQAPQTTGLPVADALSRWKFPLSLALPGYSSCTWRDDDGTLTAVGLWTEDGSTATASVNGHVRQTGPRKLWDTVEELAALFPEGPPAREDFGITITPAGQRIWHGHPAGPTWTLPTAAEVRR
jgi:protein-L-isoaspartate(D-aspartate) O-methyltransferase